MSDPEPRRSVRATKGQHKALEQLDQPIEVPKRRGGGKKGRKAAPEPEEPEEEIIRCVCGATEQDEDSGEPWIACDQCGAWQHNICMGMSQYSEDLPKEYFCEICRPENHKELLSGIENGERPWEARRKAYEEEKAEKKKRGPKKGKKRTSDLKEDASQKSKQSPPPSAENKKEPKGAGQKRKNADGAPEKESKKIKKANDLPGYTPPQDIPEKISELPDSRQGPAKALLKSLSHAIAAAEKRGAIPADGVSTADRAERFALQIERAVNDTHPNASSYASQIRTLVFNLKGNPELCIRLVARTLTPPMLASMTTEDLASKELQKETAEMRARAEKQAIKITEDMPRIRKTHKGDEFIVGEDDFSVTTEEVPSAPVRRPSAPKSEPKETPDLPSAHRRSTSGSPAVGTQQSPSRADFDLNKVFSSVKSKSPGLPHGQGPSPLATAPTGGPGVDPDIDRLLDDDAQSPPYSPKEDNDPDVVWRGNLLMNTIADVQVKAKHMGGVNLSESIGLPWDKLIPKTLTVCGRIEEQQAIVYVCSLRYSLPTDVVVVSLEPTTPAAKAGMQKLFDYFVSKKRYGVIGDKGVANVRDTYLVPLLPGGPADQPEFMLNLADNYIPETRTEPMMLAVFVYRNDPETIKRIHGTNDPNHITDSYLAAEAEARKRSLPSPGYPQPGTPAEAQGGFPSSGRASISAPAFSPTSPMGQFPTYPSPRNNTPTQASFPPQAPTAHGQVGARPQHVDELQRQGEAIAREVLGHLITSPTVAFLLPQAHAMARKEWEVIKRIYERDPKAREDLPYLSNVLERESAQSQQQHQQHQQQHQQQQHHQQHHAAPPPPVHSQPAPQPRPPPKQPQHQQPRRPSHPTPQPQQQPQPHPQHQYQNHNHTHQPPAPVRHTAIPPPPIPPHAPQNPPPNPPPQQPQQPQQPQHPQHSQHPPQHSNQPPQAGHAASAVPAAAAAAAAAPGGGGPPRQTPIPPPPIPPQATLSSTGPGPGTAAAPPAAVAAGGGGGGGAPPGSSPA
ncbi:hypothetical protein VTK26DRAFT_417 [Humicola hyalothermophila]